MARRRPDPSPWPDAAPPGVKFVCLVRALAVGVALLGVPALLDRVALAGAVVAVSLTELAVLWGLWTLRRRAWSAAVAVWSLTAALAVGRGQWLAAGLAVAALAYVGTRREFYRRHAGRPGPTAR